MPSPLELTACLLLAGSITTGESELDCELAKYILEAKYRDAHVQQVESLPGAADHTLQLVNVTLPQNIPLP